jgi:hypothetical protein
MKASSLHRTKHDDDSENENENEEDLDDDPELEYKFLKHNGAVNRLRVNLMNYENSHKFLTDDASRTQHYSDLV